MTGPRVEPLPEIDVVEAHRRLGTGVALIDVREQHEWDEVHATGAQHLPLGELPQRVGELPGGPLMFICRSGARSARAADWVLGQGRDTTNVAGGTDAWVVAGLPTG